MTASKSDMGEDQIIALYRKATSGDDPDKIDMRFIENSLRKLNITLRRPAGASAFDDGVVDMSDVKMATTALMLFGGGPKKPATAAAAQASSDSLGSNITKWKNAGLAAGKTRSLIRDLFALDDSSGVGAEGTVS